MADVVQTLCERGTMLRYMYIANLFAWQELNHSI